MKSVRAGMKKHTIYFIWPKLTGACSLGATTATGAASTGAASTSSTSATAI